MNSLPSTLEDNLTRLRNYRDQWVKNSYRLPHIHGYLRQTSNSEMLLWLEA